MGLQTSDANIISTGFQDIDKLFISEGLLPGSIISMRSDPTSSAQEFLLMMLSGSAEHEKSLYITSSKTESTIERQLHRLEVMKSDDIIVEELFNDPKYTDMAEQIRSNSSDVNLIIVDKLNDFEYKNSSETEIYQELKQIAIDFGCVIVLNHILSSPHNTSEIENLQLTQNSDYLFSFTKQYTQDKILEKFWIERIPVNSEFKDVHSDIRMVQIDNSENKLTLDTGGTI